MNICKYCGKEIPEDTQLAFCPWCGRRSVTDQKAVENTRIFSTESEDIEKEIIQENNSDNNKIPDGNKNPKKKVFIITCIVVAIAVVAIISFIIFNGKGQESASISSVSNVSHVSAESSGANKVKKTSGTYKESIERSSDEALNAYEDNLETATPSSSPMATPNVTITSVPIATPIAIPSETPIPTEETANYMIIHTNTDEVNVRSESKHASDFVCQVNQSDDLYYYGEIGEGYGSDGNIHQWCKVTVNGTMEGWIRADYLQF